jgi:hypothetical protein
MFDGRRGVTDAGTGGHCRRSGGRIASLVSVLVLACGGMAEGVAPGEGGGDDAPQATASSSPASGPGRPSRNPSGTRSVTCYSPDDLDDSPLLEQVLPFLPRDAFDSNGCLAASYTSWLVADRCSYDADGANLRGGQCCYELDDQVPECERGPR